MTQINSPELRCAIEAIENVDDELADAQLEIKQLKQGLAAAEERINELLDELHETDQKLEALQSDIATQVAAYRAEMAKS